MIDLNNLEKYRENNRIEAKTALGGLPHSIWETYSAFANTLGGIILLGVQEYKDKSFHVVDLPEPERLKQEFWDAVNDPETASVNVLSTRNVRIETVDGKRIIVINVPPADRSFKPVYVEGNASNTYRRNGEGDYKCTREEIQKMFREAAIRSQDSQILEEMDLSVLNEKSISKYRKRMKTVCPGHMWEELDDEDFLKKTGCAGIGKDGEIHPTAGGLLMFGSARDITSVFPDYSLDYREAGKEKSGYGDRIISASGDWSGNLFDFYFRIASKLQKNVTIPFVMENSTRMYENSVRMAMLEALVNCLDNADYYGQGGIVIDHEKNEMAISNPGPFRIDFRSAVSGGRSNTRNNTIARLFHMIDIGEGIGSGIPSIYRIWKDHNWQEPRIRQENDPARTTIILPLADEEDGKDSESKEKADPMLMKMVKRHIIIDFLTEKMTATSAELADYLDLSRSRVNSYLKELIADGIVVCEGENRNRIYKLKS